jgi:hypothetical protein
MNKVSLYSRIETIEKEVSHLSNSITLLKSTDITHQPSNFQSLSMNIALRSERMTCQLRNIVLTIPTATKAEYMAQVQEMHDIHIAYEHGILLIELPGLLPKRQVHSNTAFLNDPLHYAFQHYLQMYPLPVFNGCVISFTQVYDESLDIARVRDYDNLEFKQLLDTIGTFVLQDDGGMHCDTYHTTKLGKEDYTLIHIMEKQRFPDWLKATMEHPL